jgi:ferritin-like protein
MALDETRLSALLEQSHDLHTDAMATTRVALDEYVELAHDEPLHDDSWQDVDPATRRATLLGGLPKTGLLAAAGLGTAMAALIASPAFADKTMDVQMLQTAASIENLAIATYETALTLDFVGGSSANGVVKAFVEKTKEQHTQHAEAFNAAATRLGGKSQDQPDPVLLGVVNNAKPSLTGPAEVVDLAIQLEDGAAQTYVANTGAYSNKNARSVAASIMGVEAQHVAILNAVKALLAGGAADLIALPPDAAQLPAAAGSVGFPNAFYPTTDARPANEGAVQ